jgi:hypothetical protein
MAPPATGLMFAAFAVLACAGGAVALVRGAVFLITRAARSRRR